MITYPFGIETLEPLWWFDFSRTDKMTVSGISVEDVAVVDGVGVFTQSDGGRRGDLDLGPSGRDVILFTGSNNDRYSGAGVTSDPGQSFELTAVINPIVGAATVTVFSQEDGTGTGRAILSVTNTGLLTSFLGGANTSGTTNLGDGKYHVLTFRHNTITNVLRAYVDGVLETTQTRNVEPATGEWVLGANKLSTGNFFDGRIAELIMLPSEMSGTIFNTYQKALCAKWQIEYKG